MTKYYKIYIVISFLYLMNHSSLMASAPIPPEMKVNAEKAIQSCEQTYQNVVKQGARFDSVKKPTLLSSTKTKEAYKNLEVNKAAYNLRMAEFTQFTNDKIKIRTAKSLNDLRDQVAAYSSNCARFASGLAGFVEWAVTGQGPAGFEGIYKDWQNEARAKMKK